MVEANEQDKKRYEDMHVKYKLDPHNMPSLTAKQRAEVAALVAQTDKQINKSDIVQLDRDFFEKRTALPFYEAIKQSTTVRLVRCT